MFFLTPWLGAGKDLGRDGKQSVKRRNVTDAHEVCEQKVKSGKGELALKSHFAGYWVHGSLEHALKGHRNGSCAPARHAPDCHVNHSGYGCSTFQRPYCCLGIVFFQLNHKVHEQICAEEFCKVCHNICDCVGWHTNNQLGGISPG